MYQQITGANRQQDLETRILERWRSLSIFARAQERRAQAPPFTFYEGPPTANGRPGIHHVIARTLKDVICRYRDMTGFYVERKAGWDTHGLPVEVEVEKELGIHGKEAIEAFGVEEFTRRCIDSVFKYVGEWERLTDRIGYWLDLDNAYVTYHQEYVESVWWALSELFKKDLLYRSHKVVWWWPQGGTALSSGEVGYGYKETIDPSVTVRFRWKEAPWDKPTSFLAWTTTPWTLPSNVGLCVGPDLDYVAADLGDEIVVVARERLAEVLGDRDHSVLATMKGSELVGATYEPLFDYARPEGGKAYQVVADDFVSTESGTGIVHLAPGFGEDDTRIARATGLGFLQLVQPDGTFPPEVKEFAGRYIKEADKDIMRHLAQRGLVFSQGTCKHEYPFCWRSMNDPLIQYARKSWFIRTTAYKKRLLELNEGVNWLPPHIKEGRFGDFLRNNVDWALSRERFWGTPLPIWINDTTGKAECVASVQQILARNPRAFEAFDRAAAENPNLSPHLRVHKPWIDKVTWTIEGEPGTYRRVPDVIDCWFDSGSMPFAQRGYPWQGIEEFKHSFPADFICEGLDQTRGWFYSLLAISTLLFDKAPYRNVIVNGLVLDKKGQKMSKSLGNTVDPWDVISTHGADPLRWYLLESNPPWASTRFDPEGVAEVQRRIFGTLWPSYNFFAMYAAIDGYRPGDAAPAPSDRPVMDRWLLSRISSLNKEWRRHFEAYDPTRAVRLLASFIVDELSNWYIRRSRPRFWKSRDEDDKAAAYDTLHRALNTVAFLIAPIAPMSADALYLGIHPDGLGLDSVHLGGILEPDEHLVDEDLEARMAAAITVVSLGRAAREAAGVRVRQPLQRLVAIGSDRQALEGLLDPDLRREILAELNVKDLEIAERSGEWCRTEIKPNLPVLGPRFGKDLGRIRKALAALSDEAIAAFEDIGRLELDLDGRRIELGPDDLLVQRTGKEGYAVASGSGFVVALDTQFSEELRAEGLRRELINRIQNHRKKKGYEVTTRIAVRLYLPQAVAGAVRGHEEEIAREVLAEELSVQEDLSRIGEDGVEEATLLDDRIGIASWPVPRP